MIRLGLRLTLHGGKEAIVRLVITVAAVALGVGLLLIALAGMNAINAQNARSAWLNTGMRLGPGPGQAGLPPGAAGATTSDPLWWLFDTDYFGKQAIDRVDVAATGPTSPVPPGISHLPGPGQFYASPALSRLLHQTPADLLGDRFPGTQIGTIGSVALPAPNSLIIIIGHTASSFPELRVRGRSPASIPIPMSTDPTAGMPTSCRSSSPSGPWHCSSRCSFSSAPPPGWRRLAGSSGSPPCAWWAPRQGRSRCSQPWRRRLRPSAAWPWASPCFSPWPRCSPIWTSPGKGSPPVTSRSDWSTFSWWRSECPSPPLRPLASPCDGCTSRRSGVTRKVTPSPPRAYRLVPLAAGVAELVYFVVVGHPKSTGAQIEAYFSGCLLIMAGLVIAGPWLTMVGSRVMARGADRPSVLLAGRRLSDNPRGAFRAISGLIIALFATSVSVGIITTILDDHGTSGGGAGASDTLIQQFQDVIGPRQSAPAEAVPAIAVPNSVLAALHSIEHVQGVTVIYANPGPSENQPGSPDSLLVACDQLAHTPALGRCPPGAAVVAISGSLDSGTITGKSSLATRVWPAAAISSAELPRLPAQAIVVGTNGSRTAIERARTTLELAWPNGAPATLAEINANNTRTVAELQQMTNVVILVSLVIAGCSLAVSVTAGINDRKRPFSLLRLTGVPIAVLRGVVALEAAVPLLLISVLSSGMGFLAAGLFLNSQLSESLRPPGPEYYVIVVAGLVAGPRHYWLHPPAHRPDHGTRGRPQRVAELPPPDHRRDLDAQFERHRKSARRSENGPHSGPACLGWGLAPSRWPPRR